jgi:hypothetical protein
LTINGDTYVWQGGRSKAMSEDKRGALLNLQAIKEKLDCVSGSARLCGLDKLADELNLLRFIASAAQRRVERIKERR